VLSADYLYELPESQLPTYLFEKCHFWIVAEMLSGVYLIFDVSIGIWSSKSIKCNFVIASHFLFLWKILHWKLTELIVQYNIYVSFTLVSLIFASITNFYILHHNYVKFQGNHKKCSFDGIIVCLKMIFLLLRLTVRMNWNLNNKSMHSISNSCLFNKTIFMVQRY